MSRLIATLQKTILLIAFAALSVASFAQTDQSPELEKTHAIQEILKWDYNFVIISVDTLSYEHLGCYGYKRDTSPNIDKFAKKCFKFNNAISAAGSTAASYTSLFTSTYPLAHRTLRDDVKIPSSLPMLSEILKDEGYLTSLFSELGWLTPEFGINRGFVAFNIEEKRYNPQRYDRVVKWLHQIKYQKFFLFFYTNDVHGPYLPPEPFNKTFYKDKFYDDSQDHQTEPITDRAIIEGAPQSKNYYISQYDGAIRYTDHQIGKILDALEQEDLLRNTIVIITADHGESLGEHDINYWHGWFWEEIIKVPFLMYVPNTKPREFDEQIQLVDVAPTILDLIGKPAPGTMDGFSFVDMLSGKKESIREYSFAFEKYYGMIRTNDFKLAKVVIERDEETNKLVFETHLYDLRNDPNELNNIADTNKAKREELEIEFMNWYKYNQKKSKYIIQEKATFDQKTLNRLKELGYLK